ncbi:MULTISPECIES: hypothetical protein [Ensifer]|uniref:hypothetical protein n=1 Tax=Ensifer TaxID=106591 RepID=UPI00070FBBA4|nr:MULTISPECIES: hypothetical protein [Ensifer]KQU88544.1 hypothetical protein ASD00_28865 [Ensifer sp. Root31]KQW56678.1 hypothetical protein ASD02_29290 [Ensifer sp. Root1252]KQW77922.1 hypothetical protein ASD03_27220 [Ensifer sp. Root127]KRC75057.1 hypothetical protein ASE32_31630 [Ensifer sp. Root231]KRC96525.1 hypothetical protein ASE47_31995 [Ensifer sp. Root258]
MSESHEQLFEDIPQGPSNRNFGYTVGGILLCLVVARWIITGTMTPVMLGFASVGGLLVLLALIYPASLTIPNEIWSKLGLLLFKVVNPVVMLIIYVTTFVPIGLLLRMRGYDPLALKFDRAAVTYWVNHPLEEAEPSTMRNQF